MRKFRLLFSILIMMMIFYSVVAAVEFSAGGYVKNMQAASFENADDNWLNANIWNTRLNLRTFFTNEITWVFGGNLNFIYSNYLPLYTNGQQGWYGNSDPRDFSFGYASNSYTAGGFFDRNYIEYQGMDWSVSAGVQRINWGMNLIWNPNDIFNAYSVYDFDYQERPGILSARGRYYISATSHVDIAATTADIFAALYRLSLKGQDIQFIVAKDNDDIIGATGFVADVFNAGLRSEATYFYNNETQDSDIIAALTADYTFSNGFYIHTGGLYNSFGVKENALIHKMVVEYDNPVKNLSAGKYSSMLQISYPFSPLVSGSILAIMNMSDYSLYFSPMLTYSMFESLEILFASQLNFGEELEEYSSDLGRSFFARLQWSF